MEFQWWWILIFIVLLALVYFVYMMYNNRNVSGGDEEVRDFVVTRKLPLDESVIEDVRKGNKTIDVRRVKTATKYMPKDRLIFQAKKAEDVFAKVSKLTGPMPLDDLLKHKDVSLKKLFPEAKDENEAKEKILSYGKSHSDDDQYVAIHFKVCCE